MMRARDRLHGDLADGAADRERRPDRRRQEADAQIEDHDDAEVHGIDAELLDDRQENRRADKKHGRQVHERAEHQQKDIDVKQEHILVARDGDEQLRGLRRNPHQRHHVGERDREADHDHDHPGRPHDAADEARQLA